MTAGTPQPTPRWSLDPVQRQAPCGADIDNLLQQVAEGRASERDEHQVHCPHCQAALIELADVWAPVRQLADQPVATPTGILAAVMRHVHRLTRDMRHTLDRTDFGAITVATRVVTAIARRAALRVPGVRVAFGRSTAAAGVMGGTAVVNLALTVTHGQPTDHIARQVQQRVISDLRSRAGLQHVVVNITVDDVIPPPHTSTTG